MFEIFEDNEDKMRAIIREEFRHEICAAINRISGHSKYYDENEYNEFAWKDHVDYDYLVRTGQHLNI